MRYQMSGLRERVHACSVIGRGRRSDPTELWLCALSTLPGIVMPISTRLPGWSVFHHPPGKEQPVPAWLD